MLQQYQQAEQIEAILCFWFGSQEQALPAKALRKKWFVSNPRWDALIEERFADVMMAAARGQLRAWEQSARGILALILLLDQFPRNVYRRSARAFATDPQALDLCLRTLAVGLDDALPAIQRSFVLMPLMHAESLHYQDQAVQELQGLIDTVVAEQGDRALLDFLRSSLSHVQQHRALLQRFGRFPHRNAVLGRQSSEAEIAYLDAGGARFGQ